MRLNFFIAEFLLATAIAPCSQAALAQHSLDAPLSDYPTIRVEYSKPISVMTFPKGSGLLNGFQCGDEGRVITLMDIDDKRKDSNGRPAGHITLMSLNLKGEKVAFPWDAVPGYNKIRVPSSFFFSDGKLYVLTRAEKQSVSKSAERTPAGSIVLVFDQSGALKTVIPLDGAIDPISFGVFPSGNLLILSEDELNQRMRLTVVDSTGRDQKELRLFDQDYLKHKGPIADGPKGPVSFSPETLIGFTDIVSSGESLLLVPTTTSGLPILELNEGGIVRSVVPSLPKGTVLSGLIPTQDRTWKVRLGSLNESTYRFQDGNGMAKAAGVVDSSFILEIDRNDGRVLRQIDLGPAFVHPACESNGEFLMLTSDRDSQTLQLVLGVAR